MGRIGKSPMMAGALMQIPRKCSGGCMVGLVGIVTFPSV